MILTALGWHQLSYDDIKLNQHKLEIVFKWRLVCNDCCILKQSWQKIRSAKNRSNDVFYFISGNIWLYLFTMYYLVTYCKFGLCRCQHIYLFYSLVQFWAKITVGWGLKSRCKTRDIFACLKLQLAELTLCVQSSQRRRRRRPLSLKKQQQQQQPRLQFFCFAFFSKETCPSLFLLLFRHFINDKLTATFDQLFVTSGGCESFVIVVLQRIYLLLPACLPTYLHVTSPIVKTMI